MNRREFLKKSLEGIVIGIPLISSCGKNPLKSEIELQDIFIEKTLIADGFGNQDGTASQDELNIIDNYFKSNFEAWGLGGFPWDYRDKNEIPILEVMDALKNVKLDGPYKNEAELRKNYEGIGIRKVTTALLGIYVFDSGDYKSEQYRLKYFYKCGGGYISEHKFIPMVVK